MKTLKNNILGGITAAVVALPLALAFGVASGAGPIAGLYGAIILGFFASFFGGTPTQISGPTGPMTVVVATAIVTFQNDIVAVMTIVFLSGLIQISFGMVGIGKWVKFIPYPVISGFMSGIGVIIIILQINPFLGVESIGSVLQVLYELPHTLQMANTDSLIIAYMTLAIMFLTPRFISKVIPTALIALVLMTFITVYFDFSVPTIGNIPLGFPEFMLPSYFDIFRLRDILLLAITLALLGSIDTLLTSLVADSMTKTKHNPNKELIGQGIGNSLCGLFGAIPGAGATMRTVINIKSGSTSKISGMTHSLTLLLIILFLAGVASEIPLAVLAGILIKVGVDILDYKFLRIVTKVPKTDLLVMMTVFLLTIFVDLIMAVGAGITFASIMAIYKISRKTTIQTQHYRRFFDIDVENESIKVLKIDGAFFFGSALILEKKISKMIHNSKNIIIDCTSIPFMDVTGMFILEDVIEYLNEKNIHVILVLKERDKRVLFKIDQNKIFENIKIFRNIDLAVNCFQKKELNFE